MILGKSDVVNTGNEGVSNKMVEDSCCVTVVVIGRNIVSVESIGWDVILGKSDIDNEGVSNIIVEDSCCVSVGVICDIASVDTSGMSVTLGENDTVNGVAEGVSVSLTGILGKSVVNIDNEGVSNKMVEDSCCVSVGVIGRSVS